MTSVLLGHRKYRTVLSRRYNILVTLREIGCLGVFNLGVEAGICYKRLSAELPFLLKNGFITFTPTTPECKKSGHYSITEKGLAVLEAVKPLLEEGSAV